MRPSLRLAAAALLATALIPPAFAAPKTHVSVSAPWEISSLDPAQSGHVLQRLQILETLVDAGPDGALRPGLSTGWEASEDGRTWRFALRPGVIFHDGSALTAPIAAQALTRALGKPGALTKAPVEAIAAEGGAVVVALSSPFAALPAFLAHYSAGILAPSSFDADGNAVAAIGSGPFMATELNAPQSIATARFDGYWGAAPAIQTVAYLAAGRAETRALMAESGDADLVFTLDPSGYARLSSLDRVETRAVPIPRVVMLKVNAAHPFLSDVRAREALSLAIDRAGIAAAITRFPEAAATQLFPPALGDWHDPSLPPLAHDPARAQALLAELGWEKGADGILTRDGARFALTLRTFPDRPELPLIGAALQQMFRQIGVALEVSVSNYSQIPAGHQDGSLELALHARNYGAVPDPIGNALDDFTGGGSDWGAMGWEDPAVAAALEEAAQKADPAARAALIETAARGVHAGLPLIPIGWYMHTVSVAEGLEGVVVDPLERSYGLSAVRWAE